MVSKQLIDIMIKATDEASATAKKVTDNLKKIGDTASKSNKKAVDSTAKFRNELTQASNSLSVVGASSVHATNMLQQMKLDPNFSSTMQRAKLEVSQMGYSLDSVKGRFMTLKTAGTSVWGNLKSSVKSTATNLKTSLGNAIDNIKLKFQTLKKESLSLGGGMGLLSNAFGQFAGMLGFEALNGIVEAGRSAINSSAQFDYFGDRLQKMSGKTHLSAQGFQQLKGQVGDLQKEFRKVDMTKVGATAEEMAVKMQLPANKIGDLTRMTAVMSSTFVKEGRTQEDAILAVSDAMDGQFKRLQEIGISEEDLKNNGWSGELSDQASLIDALNKTMKDMGYEQTAKDITSLDEAFTVLNISMGQLLAGVLIPLTPVIVTVITTLVDGASMISNAWNSLPDWSKMAIGFGALAVALALLIPWLMALDLATVPLIGSLMALATAEITVSLPILAIVAAIGLLIVAIYEVGKAFGWWYNVQGMIQAVQTGIMRLWAAFINHPDVQGFIKMMSEAWGNFTKWVGEAWSSVLKFFGVNSSNKFYLVSSLIKGIGDAWQLLKPIVWGLAVHTIQAFQTIATIVGIAIQVGQAVYNALKPIVCILLGCSPGIVPALQTVQSVFGAVFGAIAGFIGSVVSTIVTALQPVLDIIKMIAEFMVSQFLESWNTFVTIVAVVTKGINLLISIFNMFMGGQITLSGALSLIWNVIASMFRNILILIINRVRSFATNVISLALRTGRGFVTNIITFLTTLPGRVLTILMNVARHVLTAGQQWIVNAHTKALGMVTGVINGLINLPSHMYNMLSSAVSEITKAGQEWIDEAKAKAGEIVTGVKDKLSGFAGAIGDAMSGVKDAIVKPFSDAWAKVSELASKIRNTSTRPSSMQGGYDLDVSKQINIADPGAYFGRGTVYEGRTDNLDVNINLSGVPSNMSERQLVNLLTSKGVIDALVNNNNFQSANRKATTRYNARLNRSG